MLKTIRTSAAVAALSTLLAAPVLADEVAAGKQIHDKVCAACHGKDANTPIDPSYPRLAGQHKDYLFHSLQEYKNGNRKNAIMGAQVQNLSKQDLRNLAAYYAQLPGVLRLVPTDR